MEPVRTRTNGKYPRQQVDLMLMLLVWVPPQLDHLRPRLALQLHRFMYAKLHLERGNRALSDFISRPYYAKSQVGYAYWLKGETLGYLAEIEKNQDYKKQAEEALR